MTLNLDKKFDLITAVYLLNYAQTKGDLTTMCRNIYDHLGEDGKFSTITTNPALKQMIYFEYERKFTSVAGKSLFEDGDEVKCEMNEEGKTPFEFVFYYWSKGTYEQCLREAGFKSIRWVDAIISQEGIKEYGEEYWSKFKQNPSFIGIICEK